MLQEAYTQSFGHKRSLRAQRDVMELGLGLFTLSTADTQILLARNEMVLVRIICYAGYYTGMELRISLTLPGNYPFRPPLAHVLSKVWHPNVDISTGKILHPMLDTDWKPVQSLSTVILGLTLLFLEPNPELASIANIMAAQTLISTPHLFALQIIQASTSQGEKRPKKRSQIEDSPTIPTRHAFLSSSSLLQDKINTFSTAHFPMAHEHISTPGKRFRSHSLSSS